MTDKKRGRPPVDVKQGKMMGAYRVDENTWARALALAQADEVSAARISRIALRQYLDRRGA